MTATTASTTSPLPLPAASTNTFTQRAPLFAAAFIESTIYSTGVSRDERQKSWMSRAGERAPVEESTH